MTRSRFRTYAWGVLGYNLLVILWGAFVRATGSGAGCGSHWPLCNGEVIPRPEQVATLVEFVHRLTSGVALLTAVGLLVWARRDYPAGHPVRRGAAYAMGFMVMEALLGAGLVLFEWVANDASLARAISMSLHLVNTFLLVAALALTAWWASGGGAVQLRGQGPLGGALVGGLAALVVLGMSGAVIALGDTLFFAHTRAGGAHETLPALVAAIVSIRVLHPIIAVAVGAYLVAVAWWAGAARPAQATRALAAGVTALYLVQLAAGAVNVALQVPVWMQLVHLLLADLVWILAVLLSASALSSTAGAAAPAAATAPASP
ncbi:MAG TPA: COX15/CtaA family protein [Roseiflexaceae bacterium]|nr:COX15/CtaA family protein [Roseiflexaceae bacterium]